MRTLRRLATAAVFALTVAAATLVVGPLFTRTSGAVGPGTITVSAVPHWDGSTRLWVPPVGHLDADTHDVPVRLEARLSELDVASFVSGDLHLDDRAVTEAVETGVEALVRSFALRSLLVGAVVGALAAALLPRRRPFSILAGAAVGVAALAAVAVVPMRSWDVAAFETAAYRGPLTSVRGFELLTSPRRSEVIDSKLDVVTAKLRALYSTAIDARIERSEGDVVLLHVADVHGSPTATAMISEIVDGFRPDAVIDSGDLSLFGTPLAAPQIDALAALGVPYYFVLGDHDTPAVGEQLRSAGLIPLGGQVVDVDGIRVGGTDDPTTAGLEPPDPADRDRQAAEERVAMRALVSTGAPDVLVVHRPVQATAVLGRVDVVVSGHLHRRDVVRRDGTVVAVTGPTGGMDRDTLSPGGATAARAELLRFDDGVLVAIDSIDLRGQMGEFVVRRTLVSDAIDGADDSILTDDVRDRSLEEMVEAHPDRFTTEALAAIRGGPAPPADERPDDGRPADSGPGDGGP